MFDNGLKQVSSSAKAIKELSRRPEDVRRVMLGMEPRALPLYLLGKPKPFHEPQAKDGVEEFFL